LLERSVGRTRTASQARSPDRATGAPVRYERATGELVDVGIKRLGRLGSRGDRVGPEWALIAPGHHSSLATPRCWPTRAATVVAC
jgi:hypothetical protein